MYDAFKLVDGDIQFDSLGRIQIIEGREALAQTIMHKLNTYEGELFYTETYGLSPEFYKIKKREENMQKIESYLNIALSDDIRISSVKVDSIYVYEGENRINIKIELMDRTIIDLVIT